MVKSDLYSFKPSALCSISSFFLLFSAVHVVTCSKDGCSHSCGQLHNIKPPFHLKGDPDHCGDPKYELLCEGNRTILNSSWGQKYYILDIHAKHDEFQFQIVDVGLGSGICDPSTKFSSDCYFPPRYNMDEEIFFSDYDLEFLYDSCADLLNCTRIIQNDSYKQVPCSSRNSTILYVTSNSTVNNLQPSCGILATIPMSDNFTEKSDKDMYQQLQKGFTVRWIRRTNLGDCFVNFIRSQKYNYYVNYYVDTTGLNPLQIALQIPLQIVGQIYMLIVRHIDFVLCVWENNRILLPIAITFMVLFDLLGILLVKKIIIAPISVCGFLIYKYFKDAPVSIVEKFLRNQKLLAPTRYAYNDIITITSHFKEKLGQGGFGSVFKGILPHRQLVAVKVLSSSNGNGDEFINEVSTIGRIHHKNVVRLHGFCSEGSNRALIYEYMPNGSLDKYIFSSSNMNTQRHFSWDKLNDIASCVAQGIDYLHCGCDMRILHFDIKPHNILLDQRFNPKVSDFGLAKLYPRGYSMVSISAARGTIGYIAPELVSRSFGVISHKSDVYSYGMLLLEMAGGRRNVNPCAEHSSQIYYPSWIYDRLTQTEGIEVDNHTEIREAERVLRTEINEVERKLCKVGLWCIQMNPSSRPSMSEVLDMLEANAYDLPMPPKPFCSSSQPTSVRITSLESSPSELSTISEYE